MQKKKHMTQKEIKQRAEFKKELQEKGIFPPDKKPLNRKKFAKEVLAEYEKLNKEADIYEYLLYIKQGLNSILPHEHDRKITPEQVGVLKALKIGIEIRKFEKKIKDTGEKYFKIGDLYDTAIKPILDL